MQLLRKKGLLDSPRVLFLPVDAISPNPNQPRRVFGTQELEELAGSIQALGLLQPLTVRRRADGWELVAGERRLRAAKLAGLEEVPCISLQIDDQRSSLLALVENLQRKDLDFWEEALALDRLISVYHLSQEEAARRIGKSQSAVANKLRLLKLPTPVLERLRDGGATERHARALLPLIGLAVARSFTAAMILWGSRYYHRLLLRQEHERRYQRLFLMTAELKNELYFLKKNSDDIEQVMTNAYRLYERLGEKEGESGELSALALSIARDVHEVKKDNLRIIRGIEGEVEEVYDQEQMEFQDLMHILENSTRRMLGENRASIRLECRRTANFSTQEHYRLLSILKNLVTNAIEAIQGAGGRGIVLVEERVEGDTLFLTVSDDGPGISERSMHNLFQVGYSTKFDPETGNINRGVGLPAVKSLTEELGGSVSVESQPGRGARFSVELPLHRVKGEKREK